ncbi:ABC transporter permease subunit [Rhodococcus hoagii]|nr:ABC transporter permease subunit [Prescottella equi]
MPGSRCRRPCRRGAGVGTRAAVGRDRRVPRWLGGHGADRIMDALMSAPSLVLAITIVAVLGSGITNAMLAVGLVMAPRFYRVARASTMDVRGDTYIEASWRWGVRRPGRSCGTSCPT